MSHFACPSCDDEHDIFGTGGAAAVCDDYDVPLLGDLPAHPAFDSDRTEGPAVRDGDNAMRDALLDLTEAVADRVGAVNRRRVAEHADEADEDVPTASAVER